jgi:hypothetical protein
MKKCKIRYCDSIRCFSDIDSPLIAHGHIWAAVRQKRDFQRQEADNLITSAIVARDLTILDLLAIVSDMRSLTIRLNDTICK